MKVYITDIRNNPRMLYIDGSRFVLPSRKEILRDISSSAYSSLRQVPFLRVRKCEEEEEVLTGDLVEIPEETVEEVAEPVVEEPAKEEPVVENNSVPEIIESGEVLQESVIVSQEDESLVEENTPKEEPDTVDYSSMTKAQLKEIMKEKGGDPTSMTKSNIIDWLKSH